jgi:hypothetical protein
VPRSPFVTIFSGYLYEHIDWECGGSTDISDTNVLGAPCMILRHLRLGR